jgi:hypothetical protein
VPTDARRSARRATAHYPHFVGRALHTALNDVCYAELLADLAKIARRAALYCITLIRLMTFKSAIFAR